MPPAFQQIADTPNDLFSVVRKPTAPDAWIADSTHTTPGAAVIRAQALVQAPDNNHQAMVLSPMVCFQRAS